MGTGFEDGIIKALRKLVCAPRRFAWFAVVMLAGFAIVLPARAQFNPDRAYRQNEDVRKRYPDPAVQFDTPGFIADRKDFMSHEEMLDFVYALQKKTGNLHVRIIGTSQEGRPIPLLVLSNSGFTGTPDLLRLNRPMVFLVGLQHGNEPAGGKSMLVLAKDLEPESPSSLVSFGIVPVDKRGSPPTIAAPSEVPIYRLTKPAELDAQRVEISVRQ